jgi:KipI family sensor histidine kinase inhibitor
MRIRLAGPAAVLVELDDIAQVQALHAELLRRRTDGRLPALTEIVPAARTILLDGVEDPSALAAEVVSWPLVPVEAAAGPLVVIPVVYDGEDLTWVAQQWGVDATGVAAIHGGTVLRAAFCGFAPGFAYLTGLAPRYHLPRRPTPRPRVPSGAVAVAGEFTAVYPRPSPGGWHLIGRTDTEMWDPSRAEPALVAPGTRVRFVPAGP